MRFIKIFRLVLFLWTFSCFASEALDSISPARNAASTVFTNQVAFGIEKISLDRLAAARILKRTKPQYLTPNMLSQNDSLYAAQDENFYTPIPAGKPKQMAAREKMSFWATGFGNFLSMDTQHANPKITDIASGAILGFDFYGYKNGVFSLSGGYIHNDITEKLQMGNGDSNGAEFSLYGFGYLGNGYIEGGLLGEYNRFTMKRHIGFDGSIPVCACTKASFNNWMMMPHFGGGYDWVTDWGFIEPFASIDWAISFQKTYKEKGGAPFSVKVKHQTPSILRTQLGVNFYETWESPQHTLIFEQSASYINETFFNTKMRYSFLVSSSSFSAFTYDRTMNLGSIGAEIFYKHKRTGFFLSATYLGEFGTLYMSNAMTGTLGVFF